MPGNFGGIKIRKSGCCKKENDSSGIPDRSCLERDSGSFCISVSDCGKHTVSDAVWQDSIDFLPGSDCGIHLCVDILRGWI